MTSHAPSEELSATSTPSLSSSPMASNGFFKTLCKSPVATGAAALIGVSATAALTYWIVTSKQKGAAAAASTTAESPKIIPVDEEKGPTERIFAKLEQMVNDRIDKLQKSALAKEDTSQELLFLYRKVLSLLAELEEYKHERTSSNPSEDLREKLAIAMQRMAELKAEKDLLEKKLQEALERNHFVETSGVKRANTNEVESYTKIHRLELELESARQENLMLKSRDQSINPRNFEDREKVQNLEHELEKLKQERDSLQMAREAAVLANKSLSAQGQRLMDRVKQLQEEVQYRDEQDESKSSTLLETLKQRDKTIDSLKEKLKAANSLPQLSRVASNTKELQEFRKVEPTVDVPVQDSTKMILESENAKFLRIIEEQKAEL